MKVAIIGTGYVGLPTGLGLAELGHQVVCIDKDQDKVTKLQQAQATLYEQGLKELLTKHVAKGNISFTTSMAEGCTGAKLVLIAVGTPPHKDTCEADLQYLFAAVRELAPCLSSYTVVANKSTVPVGTGDEVEELIQKLNPQASFDVISLPEFLREGYAIHDFFHPDRIVVGSNSKQASKLIAELYEPLLSISSSTKLLYVSRRSSETIKYAANSFLATKIHFINEIANFCEHTGADIYEVAAGIGLDRRIGSSFLNPGPGFGGSCFPKDTMALDAMARKYDVTLSLVHTTMAGNQERINTMASRIVMVARKLNQQPVVGVLGLAFKEGTDDCRFSPAMQIVRSVLTQCSDIKLRVFDPQAMDNAKRELSDFSEQVYYASDAQEVSHGADLLTVLTEWPEFSNLDLTYCADHMRNKTILDYRNKLSIKQAHELGFSYGGIGRGGDDLHELF